jgi:hypothetical protein
MLKIQFLFKEYTTRSHYKDQLGLFREIISLYSDHNMKHINILSEKSVDLVNVKTSSAYSYN